MKKIRFLLPLLLISLILFASCDTSTSPADDTTAETQGEPVVFLDESVGENAYIVYDIDDMNYVNAAGLIKLAIRYEIGLPSFKTLPDTMAENAREILIGDTGRSLSTDLVAAITQKSAENGDALIWGYAYRDGKLAFAANSEEAIDSPVRTTTPS